MEKRSCKKCKTTKLLKQFAWHSDGYYRHTCLTCARNVSKNWKINNPLRAQSHKNKDRELLWKGLLKHYGHRCQCCYEDEVKFLTVDHIDHDGGKHRAELKISAGEPFFRWIRRNNYPPGLQLLCFNCHFAKDFRGGCPHKTKG